MNTPVEWKPPILLPLFPAGWCLVSLIFSYLSGWQNLAGIYATRNHPSLKAHRTQSGTVGFISYRGCLTVEVTERGIYLGMMWLFRFGHRPLFIPWQEVQQIRRVKRFWGDWVVLTVEMRSEEHTSELQ